MLNILYYINANFLKLYIKYISFYY